MTATENASKMQVVKSASEEERKAQYAKIMERSKELNTKLKELWKQEQYPSIGYIQKVLGYNISGKALMRKLGLLREFFGFRELPKANLLIERKKKDKAIKEVLETTVDAIKKDIKAKAVKKPEAAKKSPAKTAKKVVKKPTKSTKALAK